MHLVMGLCADLEPLKDIPNLAHAFEGPCTCMIFKTLTNWHMCNLPCQLVEGSCKPYIPTADGHYEDPKGIK